MSFLKKLLGKGKHQSSNEQQSKPSATPTDRSAEPERTSNTFDQGMIDEACNLQKIAEQNLAILRYLCTCGELDSEKVATYFVMAEQIGIQRGEQEKKTMLNATLYIAPKLASDSKVMSGFEQVRVMLLGDHAEAMSQAMKLYNSLIPILPQDEATLKDAADFILQFTDELKELPLSPFLR